MYWRLSHKEFESAKGTANKEKMYALVQSGVVPGIIAYDSNIPVGWCSFGWRDDFVRLKTARLLKPVDDKKVISVVCFYIARRYRKKGVSSELINAVEKFLINLNLNGIMIEAYPIIPVNSKVPDVFVWTGILNSFIKNAFSVVAKPGNTRAIVRKILLETDSAFLK